MLQLLLEASEIDDLFTRVIIPQKIPGNKTPQFSLIAKELGFSIKDISFVTDTVSDIKEAYAAGVTSIYSVIADKDSKESLLKYLPEEKIIPSFYNNQNKKRA